MLLDNHLYFSAQLAYEQALYYYPDDVSIMHPLFFCYFEQKDYEKAIECLNKSAENNFDRRSFWKSAIYCKIVKINVFF